MVIPSVTFVRGFAFISEPMCDMLKDDDPVRGSVYLSCTLCIPSGEGMPVPPAAEGLAPHPGICGPHGGRREHKCYCYQ
jgi:hypothetical protein